MKFKKKISVTSEVSGTRLGRHNEEGNCERCNNQLAFIVQATEQQAAWQPQAGNYGHSLRVRKKDRRIPAPDLSRSLRFVVTFVHNTTTII